MICPICEENEMLKSDAREKEDWPRLKELVLIRAAHDRQYHKYHPAAPVKVDREAVREAFGRLGE